MSIADVYTYRQLSAALLRQQFMVGLFLDSFGEPEERRHYTEWDIEGTAVPGYTFAQMLYAARFTHGIFPQDSKIAIGQVSLCMGFVENGNEPFRVWYLAGEFSLYESGEFLRPDIDRLLHRIGLQLWQLSFAVQLGEKLAERGDTEEEEADHHCPAIVPPKGNADFAAYYHRGVLFDQVEGFMKWLVEAIGELVATKPSM